MSIVIEVDYPNNWPNLVNEVLDSMKKASKSEDLFGSLMVTKALISTYKRTLDQERAPLEFIIENLFPFLENLLVNQMKLREEFSSKVCHTILKIFCMANWMQFSRYLTDAKLKVWMVAIKLLLGRQLPPEMTNKITNWEEMMMRTDHPEWKIKTNCMKIVSR